MTTRAAKPRAELNATSLRAFQILSVLAKSEQPLGVMELARQLGIPASTAHRALATLEAREFVAQEPRSARYYLGSAARLTTAAFFNKFPIRNASMSCLRSLALLTNSTAALWVKLGSQMVRIAQIEAEREIVHRHSIGQCLPIHQCAAGLALITANSNDTPARLESRLRALRSSVRKTGFLSFESSGLLEHASPIEWPPTQPYASITIAGDAQSSFSPHKLEARKFIRTFVESLASRPEAVKDPFAHLGG